MNYTELSFPFTETFKHQALVWAGEFDDFILLENNSIPYPEGSFENMLAVGHANSEIKTLSRLENHIRTQKDWIFGFFSYELKNELEILTSRNKDYFHFPNCLFFIPETLILFGRNEVKILTENDPQNIYNEIIQAILPQKSLHPKVELSHRTSRSEYIKNVEIIRNHILQGDIYEMNYCIDFYAEGIKINALETYLKLNEISPMPFSAFGKFKTTYVMCASPERFIKKKGGKIISQPIKGTTKRGLTPEEDEELSRNLASSEKERSENIMIVDLVRNDLSRTAAQGSVHVKELCSIYSFATVHQMISTIESKLSEDFSGMDAICHAFPMGSMTGAPKISALKLIDRYENFRRGLYSGSIGFFSPNGDFDFNVVIRSILYEGKNGIISCPVGSAITFQSKPDQEYEECLLKVQTMQQALH